MEKKKKRNAFKQRLAGVFKSTVLRNLIIIGLLIVSVFCMFLLDGDNFVRTKYMDSLSNNFIEDMFDLLNIPRYNIGLEPWLVFFAIIGVLTFFMVASMFVGSFVNDMVEKKKDKFASEEKARKHYKRLFYACVLLIGLAFVFIFFMAGGFGAFRSVSFDIFVGLAYTILLCLLFMTCMVVIITFVILILRALFFLILFLATGYYKGGQGGDEEGEGEGNGKGSSLDGGKFTTKIEENDTLNKDLFPALTAMDLEYAEKGIETVESEDITLEEFTLRFQSFCCNHCKVYYELPVLRSFIAGLAASRLIILQGLSGTGKSLMPRMFSRFTGSNVFFSPVQSTWRDKTDVLGFYSEFTKSFKITDFLSDLYSASYTDKTTMIVLDEMNLSRIEYYFADFLSILEYPKEEWKIKVYDPELGQKLPEKLTDGYVQIPPNTWFIGTANTDDSTFTITDKVYDRAITLEFRERVNKITSDYMSDPLPISSEKLQALFDEAKANEEYCLSDLDTDKFLNICDFIRDAFDIRFGNRIMVQINQFVPVYVALGGTKEAALDFMLASKVLRKLEGMFEDYVKDELLKLTKMLHSTYGKGVMVETERVIAKILRRLV